MKQQLTLFQSPCRDSDRSLPDDASHHHPCREFQSPCRDSDRSLLHMQADYRQRYLVSIPLSGFRSFTLDAPPANCRLVGCFNPLVGIQIVHSERLQSKTSTVLRFNPLVGIQIVHSTWLLILSHFIRCFNPLVGIQIVHSCTHRNVATHPIGFNPLVGIQIVHSQSRMHPLSGRRGFNPLVGIQIVHSSFSTCVQSLCPVSIPLSGFRSFTLPRDKR